jgi:glyoxylase-like metal-dependent hydrolase (beta-lactamase superfamily II)
MITAKFFHSLIFSAILALNITSLTMGQTLNKELKVGDLKVHKLQDGQIFLPVSYLSGIEHSDAVSMVGSDSAATPVNAFLIQTTQHTILVDAGMGAVPGKDAGHLLEQLSDAGVKPEQVDLILITHFHFDHIGGLTSQDGKRVFPNATVRASQSEYDFWFKNPDSIPEKLRDRANQLKAIFGPYISANAFKPILPNEDLGNGIQAVQAFGHTPGHTVYIFSSKGKEFWCIGDLIHFGSVQFNKPMVSIVFDSNSTAAVLSRNIFFKRAAKTNSILGGAHLFDMVQLKEKDAIFVPTPIKD